MTLEIKIVYEDEYIVAVNKPSGLIMHPDGINDQPTLTDWIIEKYPETKDVGEDIISSKGETIKKPGLVHRIDKATSGIVIIAKTKEAHVYIKEQFKNHKVKKIYRALVYGIFKEKEGVIDKPIGRSKKDSRIWMAYKTTSDKTRDAKTAYKVLDSNEDASLLELYPETGRTHQLRVHLKSINHPVLCDYIYAKKRPCPENIGRLALHALSINLILPNGVNIIISSEMPKEFKDFLAREGAL